MARKEMVLVILSILLLIWISNGEIDKFDYYQVVLQWQPATCSSAALKSACENTPKDHFSIHGVWPSMFDGSLPQCSEEPPYDGTKISTIREMLNEDWPSVIYKENPTFWSHEWTRHGTCTSLSQLEYFEFGLDTYHAYDVLSILKGKNIDPDGHRYKKDNVRDAIRNITGKFPALRCNQNDYDGHSQLHEVALCFTEKDLTLRDCLSKTNTCGPNFHWNKWSLSSSYIKAVDNRATATYDVV